MRKDTHDSSFSLLWPNMSKWSRVLRIVIMANISLHKKVKTEKLSFSMMLCPHVKEAVKKEEDAPTIQLGPLPTVSFIYKGEDM